MADLEEKFNSITLTQQRGRPLADIGGIRKSQAATYSESSYGAQQREPNLSILWPFPGSSAPCEQGYRDLAAELALSQRLGNDHKVEILTLISRWLSDDSNRRCLLILDKGDNEHMSSQNTKPCVDSIESQKSAQSALIPYEPPKATESSITKPLRSMAARNLLTTQQLEHIAETKVNDEEDSLAPTEKLATEAILKTRPSKPHTRSSVKSNFIPSASMTATQPAIPTSRRSMAGRNLLTTQ
ncbi:hypothetical protein N7540_001394 [Penicillium herquei]|nr:hypothetical protein N7540_001394 [Penicillium herquei]